MSSPLQIHSSLDERGAAFLGLGLSRVHGDPIALLCTSGSAGAHYLPALLEAKHAGAPLIALTADRPGPLQHCGANQTVDQRLFFLAACSEYFDLSCGDDVSETRRCVARAVAIARSRGTPVHINLRLRKPLEHSNQASAETPIAAPREIPLHATRESLSPVRDLCKDARRGVIIAGPNADSRTHPEVLTLGRRTGFPIFAEATSGVRFLGQDSPESRDALSLLLEEDAVCEKLRPDVAILLGHAPASKGLLNLIAHTEEQVHLAPLWQHDQGAMALRVPGELGSTLHLLNQTLDPREPNPVWRKLQDISQQCTRAALNGEEANSEALALRNAIKSLPDSCLLTLGNSLIVRAADWIDLGEEMALQVRHQRGLSGIDGLIASAVGSSLAFDGPSALVLGDVSFAHDASSLALAAKSRRPLLLIVIDNGGGRIFEHLPLATLPLQDAQRALWTTPPAIDFSDLARAYGVAYRHCQGAAPASQAIALAARESHCTLIHIEVAPRSLLEFRTRLSESIRQAVRREGPLETL